MSSVAESPVARREGASARLEVRLGGFADWLERLRRSPLYAALLHGAAGDAAAGGVVARAFEGVDVPPGSVPALRLMAALHHLVLSGQAPELARFYPSVGGDEPPAGAWPVAEAALRARLEQVRARLRRGVQTNEPGRCAALYGALLWAGERYRRPLRLLEIGASAGLNLLVERYRYVVGGQRFGATRSPVCFEQPWRGRPVPDCRAAARRLSVIERRGCDPAPIDVRAEGTRELLLSYVWPDEHQRLQRLQAALELACAEPPTLERAHASRWLPQVLGAEDDGVAASAQAAAVPVVFQSVVWQYLPAREREAITLAIEQAAARRGERGLVWLTFEPGEQPIQGFELAARAWPDGRRVLLAHGEDHGPPIRWLTAS